MCYYYVYYLDTVLFKVGFFFLHCTVLYKVYHEYDNKEIIIITAAGVMLRSVLADRQWRVLPSLYRRLHCRPHAAAAAAAARGPEEMKRMLRSVLADRQWRVLPSLYRRLHCRPHAAAAAAAARGPEEMTAAAAARGPEEMTAAAAARGPEEMTAAAAARGPEEMKRMQENTYFDKYAEKLKLMQRYVQMSHGWHRFQCFPSGLNEARGAHDEEQQSARSGGARREARAARRRTAQRASRRPE